MNYITFVNKAVETFAKLDPHKPKEYELMCKIQEALQKMSETDEAIDKYEQSNPG